MRRGLSLQELAAKIEGNRDLKHDMVASTSAFHVSADTDGTIAVRMNDQSASYPILRTAHDQIGARLQIPGKYYDRMLTEAPELLSANVNTWLKHAPERRLLRTLGGDLRAFLSDRYQRIENEEIAQVALPILADIPDVKIVSAEITERRMFISAVSPRTFGEVKVGDVVQAGVQISNSEIGYGAVVVQPLVYRLACLNGLVIPDQKFAARHVGRQLDERENLNGIFADDTRRADDHAILLKVRDMIRAAVDEVRFGETVQRLAGLTTARVEGDPAKAVEILAKKVGANEAEKGGILRSLIEGGDLSAWGMLNAVTHQAHTASTYDRSMDFVAAGGALLTLPKSDWREILEAA